MKKLVKRKTNPKVILNGKNRMIMSLKDDMIVTQDRNNKVHKIAINKGQN